MPKQSTYPVIINSLLRISTKNLRLGGYFGQDYKIGSMTCKVKNRFTGKFADAGSISITVSTEYSFVELEYYYKDELITYCIPLVTIPSNLGTGNIWYFYCPVAKKRCKMLYLYAGRFVHREKVKGMYSKQIESKFTRDLMGNLDRMKQLCEIVEGWTEPYFKKHYNGIQTKRHCKILAAQKEFKIINELELTRLGLRHR